MTAVALLVASALNVALGLPTALCGALTAAVVLLRERKPPLPLLKEISWGVLPLVAGLFVLVEAVGNTGIVGRLARLLQEEAARSASQTSWLAGLAAAFGCNVMNNLPAGLIAGDAVRAANVDPRIASAILIGIDLGPNLSVTGSLATILWLTALRREGQQVSAGQFLQLGLLVMPPALIAALAATLLTH